MKTTRLLRLTLIVAVSFMVPCGCGKTRPVEQDVLHSEPRNIPKADTTAMDPSSIEGGDDTDDGPNDSL